MRPEFFDLKKGPFETESDYDLSYFSEQHGRAVNLMGHALWNRACLVTIFGEHGIGKTMLVERFLKGLRSVTGLVKLGTNTPNIRVRIAYELQEFLPVVLTSIDFRQGPELGVRTEDEVDTGAGPLEFARCAITTLEHVLVLPDGRPLHAHVEQVGEEVPKRQPL